MNNQGINFKTTLIILGLGLVGGIGGYAIANALSNKTEKQNIIETQVSMPTLFDTKSEVATNIDFTSAAEKCIDGVVHVKTKYIQENEDFDNPLYQFFFGIPQMESRPVQASGSGVIISNDGYIVTNNHVIENSTSIEVVLNDKRTYDAKLIGRDPATDIALLKIEAPDLTVIPFGNSDNVKIGEWVLAIGNPFNLTSTVTAGIVSAKARNINIINNKNGYSVESFIQTDAAVNPGNSGGALINIDGQLVGINTAIASQTGNFAGYAFAVPVSIVQKVISDLMEYGMVQRALLGIQISDVNQEIADEAGLSKIQGVYVAKVIDGGSADDAGIKEKDIILSINGKNVNSVAALQENVSQFRPGDKTTVEYIHNGKKQTTEITFKNSENTMAMSKVSTLEVLGASFEELSKDDLKALGIKNGVKVTDINSGKLMSAGVRKGFVIVTINGNNVNSIQDIQRIIETTKGGVFIEGVYPNGKAGYFAFGL
ncbi:MAG: Do family serine endopeptidase [Bacteroidales bacterium]|nr:Do family serine endopeptidase [Bacteroidales bacterium]